MFHVLIKGFVKAPVTERRTKSGHLMHYFDLAVNDKRTTVWVRCCFFGLDQHKGLQMLKKGSQIIVSGSMQKPKIYEGKKGAMIDLTVFGDTFYFVQSEPKHMPPPTEPTLLNSDHVGEEVNAVLSEVDEDIPF